MQTTADPLSAVDIPADGTTLCGHLQLPEQPQALVLFAHGTGSSRHSPRNRRVAEFLQEAGYATLLFDLLSSEERAGSPANRRLRFDVNVLSQRLRAAHGWARNQPETASLVFGYFGAGTGAAAALLAAARPHAGIGAVVTRGAHPALADPLLTLLAVPTMLIVGGNDTAVVARNLESWARLTCAKAIEIIPGTGHSFEEPGALDNVAALATRWFEEHLGKGGWR